MPVADACIHPPLMAGLSNSKSRADGRISAAPSEYGVIRFGTFDDAIRIATDLS